MTSREYTTLLPWLSSVQLPQTVQQLTQEPLAVSPSVERTPVQLPPSIAGRITAVFGSTQLTLEDLPFDDIPYVVVSALLDRQLVTYLCQRRAALSLQCTYDSAASIECLVPLRTVMAPYTKSGTWPQNDIRGYSSFFEDLRGYPFIRRSSEILSDIQREVIGLTNRYSFLPEANRVTVWGRRFECEHRLLFR
jgi:hypothetical protein